MRYEMQIGRMLGENIDDFINFVHKNYENRNKNYYENLDKLYQVKLLIEEYKFKLTANELMRINRYRWDEKYTYLLVDEFKEGLNTINEYVDRNYNDLFLLTARLYTLKSLSSSFKVPL